MIRGAAAGEVAERERFARRYIPVVRAYLVARWRASQLLQEIDDAVQEVFFECFRGALDRADPSYGFRGLLYGIARNVARRHEERFGNRRERSLPDALAADEDSLARTFDRVWAASILEQARERLAELAIEPDARRRIELLRLRFEEGLPVRDIAALWEDDPARVHRAYARARKEFRSALMDVVRYHQPGSDAAVAEECSRLLAFFS